jgi:hypothetical protein
MTLGRVARGVAPPGLPQIRTCGFPASGSSSHGLAAHGCTHPVGQRFGARPEPQQPGFADQRDHRSVPDLGQQRLRRDRHRHRRLDLLPGGLLRHGQLRPVQRHLDRNLQRPVLLPGVRHAGAGRAADADPQRIRLHPEHGGRLPAARQLHAGGHRHRQRRRHQPRLLQRQRRADLDLAAGRVVANFSCGYGTVLYQESDTSTQTYSSAEYDTSSGTATESQTSFGTATNLANVGVGSVNGQATVSTGNLVTLTANQRGTCTSTSPNGDALRYLFNRSELGRPFPRRGAERPCSTPTRRRKSSSPMAQSLRRTSSSRLSPKAKVSSCSCSGGTRRSISSCADGR